MDLDTACVTNRRFAVDHGNPASSGTQRVCHISWAGTQIDDGSSPGNSVDSERVWTLEVKLCSIHGFDGPNWIEAALLEQAESMERVANG